MQYGPGAENAFAGIASAFSDSAPVLLLPLGHPRDTAQIFPMFKSTRTYASVTKSVEELTLPDQVVPAMRRAFSQLKNGRLGPVMLEVPADVVTAELGADAIDYSPSAAARSGGDPRDMDEAAKLLLEARGAACSIAGQGVLYAEASEELVALADLLQAPVMTSVDGKSAFPEDHPLALGTGGIVYTGHGRHFLDECRCRARHRLQLHAAQHHHARRSRRARRSSTPPTTRATCTRPTTSTCRSSAMPSWCSRS